MSTAFVPPARPEIADPGFWRPDWTVPDHGDPRLLRLNKNENTDPAIASLIRRLLSEMDPRSVTFYPDCAPLYAKLAEHLGVSAHALLLAPGCDGVIGSVFRTFVAPGDRVLFPQPTYRMYGNYAHMAGATAVTIEYAQRNDGPFLPVDTLLRLITDERPKLICLPNPDSPTGTVLGPDELEHVMKASLDVGAIILIDEAYHPFHPNTVVPRIADFPNLIAARTFSKAWGMSGLRLGYAVAAPATALLLHKVRPCYEVNAVAVHLALRMLNEYEGEMQASVRRLNAGRDTFVSAMRELDLPTLQSHGSFAHVAFGRFGETVHTALASVALYTASLAPPLETFSRFSATTPELFQPVIDTIRRVVHGRS